MIAEIIGPDGRIHYRRTPFDPIVGEARRTRGYSVRMVKKETDEPLTKRKGGPTVSDPLRPYCKADQSCCDFCCGN